jgi:hypothetical protein
MLQSLQHGCHLLTNVDIFAGILMNNSCYSAHKIISLSLKIARR